MPLDQTGQAVVDLPPDLARHHGFQRRGGNLEGEIARPAMAGIDDRAGLARPAVRASAGEKARDLLDRLLGRREADAQQPVAAERGQALERERQVSAALVRRQGMDLVDDHGARGREHAAAGFGAEQDVERFRRRDDDMRRAAAHALALARRRVARAHPGPDLHVRQALGAQRRADAGKRRLQVTLNVVRERLERRDVDDLRLVPEPPLQPLAQEPIDRREKGGKRLPGSRRRGDQRVAAGLDRRPSPRLRCRGCSEATIEPSGDRRMKQGKWLHGQHWSGARQIPDHATGTWQRPGATAGIIRIGPGASKSRPHVQQPNASR